MEKLSMEIPTEILQLFEKYCISLKWGFLIDKPVTRKILNSPAGTKSTKIPTKWFWCFSPLKESPFFVECAYTPFTFLTLFYHSPFFNNF